MGKPKKSGSKETPNLPSTDRASRKKRRAEVRLAYFKRRAPKTAALKKAKRIAKLTAKGKLLPDAEQVQAV